MARMALVAVGSRGDVQPFVALGKGLKAAGHEVRLVTHAEFQGFVESHGLDFHVLGGSPREALARHDAANIGGNQAKFTDVLVRELKTLAVEMFPALVESLRGMDGIVYSMLGFPAYHVANAMGIPCLAAYLQPVIIPTREFASIGTPSAPRWLLLGGWYNRFTHQIANLAFWLLIRGTIEPWRTGMLGLPPTPPGGPYRRLSEERHPMLYGYSAAVMPRPADWPDHATVTGYWFLEGDGWTPRPDLVDFLRSGPPPVYVGFGSMPNRSPEEAAALVIDALRMAGQRGILLTGWSGLEQSDLPEMVFRIDSAPHDWLFPRMAAVVHHGGAGTTGAGLRAGVPSILIPFFGDQFFWGERVARLGVGPKPIPRPKLSAGRLAEAIRVAVSDGSMRARAAALGETICAEDGIGNAVRIIGNVVG